ncbi:MAG: glycoside hydrolase family 30 protein [Saprospiraceae bacterium]|nr:glycoside hydrolase family 30 protein [Saprospiraceae bacterium]
MKTPHYLFFVLVCLTSSMSAQSSMKAKIYATAKGTSYRLSSVEAGPFEKAIQPFENEPAIFVDESHSYQEFLGIGGAFTDAAAETFYTLSEEKQKEVIDLYFDTEKGIGYTLGRTNINSCDFSSDMYTYVKEGDKTLSSFDIAHDRKYKIPFIEAALEKSNKQLKLYVSPWSPPAYMKDNRDMLKGGKLLPEFKKTWAEYFVKFIKAYESSGIPVWGLTVQNEPMAKQTWESCIYTAEEEAMFIRDYLGPALHKNGLKSKKLIAWDHNRDLIYHRVLPILGDKKTAKYVWGIGFHWYEVWNGGRQYQNVARVKESFPNTNLMLTEACNYPFDWETFDQWHWGEHYGENMIHDFNNGAVAWTDWNLLLDEVGGPNHVKNFCFAPMHARTKENSIHLMNSYYYIGHFSKFIRPGAKRISVSSNRAQLLCTAFKNSNGSRVVVAMNNTDERFQTWIYSDGFRSKIDLWPHGIVTILLEKR